MKRWLVRGPTDPERLAPPTSALEPDGRSEFPVEAEEVPAGSPAVELSFDKPQSATPASDAIIEVDGDATALPGAEKLMLHSQQTTSVEQYRRLAARLLMAQVEKGTRLVMITSAFPG